MIVEKTVGMKLYQVQSYQSVPEAQGQKPHFQGLKKDTVSFGNKSDYSFATYKETFANDFDIVELMLSQEKVSPNALTKYKTKMADHFHGLLAIMESPSVNSTTLRTEISESLYKSKFAYQACSESLGDSQAEVYKLEPELIDFLENKGFAQLTPNFMVEYSNWFNLTNEQIKAFERLAQKDSNATVLLKTDSKKSQKAFERLASKINEKMADLYGDGNVAKVVNMGKKDALKDLADEEDFNPVKQAEDFLAKNVAERKKLALTRVQGKDPDFVKAGYEDLMKLGAYKDLTGLIKKLTNPNLIYDIGSMLKSYGAGSKAFLKNLTDVKNIDIPAVVKTVLIGASR